MDRDEIIEEVRTIRERLAAQKGYDIRALYEEAKKRQQESDRKVVALVPKLLENTEEKTPVD